MRLKHLEIALQRIAGFPHPRASLEQYQTPAPLAARLLYHAHSKGDIQGKNVYDLGSGTGMIAIGAALLGARRVQGVEIDPSAIVVAIENATLLEVKAEFTAADVRDAPLADRLGPCDTVVMNPPFGAQKAHADRPFIDFAIRISPVTYGIFNTGSIPFIEAYISGWATIDERVSGIFPIRRTFAFHKKDVREIGVEILRLVRN
jgi:putative methylase